MNMPPDGKLTQRSEIDELNKLVEAASLVITCEKAACYGGVDDKGARALRAARVCG